MKNAVIYARSASFNEDSLRTQIVLCKKFADDNGYTVVRIFADNNASGMSAKRPALQRLLKDINSSWETVIILDHSRFFREPRKYIEYMLKLNFAGKRIITAIEQKEALLWKLHFISVFQKNCRNNLSSILLKKSESLIKVYRLKNGWKSVRLLTRKA